MPPADVAPVRVAARRLSPRQRLLVAADLLIVAVCLAMGLVVTAAFAGPGRFHPYAARDFLIAAAQFGGVPLLLVGAVIAAARALAGRGRSGWASATLATPLVLAAAATVVLTR